MDKLNPTQLEPRPAFTEPEMEVALQLIQLSGESYLDLRPNELSNPSCNTLTTTNMKRRRKEIVDDDDDESHASCNSHLSFFITPSFMDLEDKDVAGSRRKRKKFRSVVEIYEISNQCL
ncbi:hypothetical protein L2E82_36767 [Cichorium intybus]|uniref:Uncharacterized protein n=1 Tax=Cichorium intybus TaxID=13427 RepID=A0ACB9ADT8_CICIN|nr:hypothetical protein L2E82_36767 [Cichorium intybus]